MRRLPLAFLLVVACSHKDTSVKQDLPKLGQEHPSGHQYGTPTGKIRIVNVAEMQGKPIGPVDLYDVRQPDSTTQPLIKNLAYGQASDYVSPRAGDNYSGSPSQLYLNGTNIDNSGFAATDQMTIALGPSSLFNGQSIGYPSLVEAGKRNPQWIDTSRGVPPGKALLITLQANVGVSDSLPGMYLMIDGTCPLASNFTSKIPTAVGTEVHFLVAPGSHSLGLVTSPRGQGLLNCSGKTPVVSSASTANVAAGGRYIVIIYGLPSDGLKTLTLPIAG